MGAHQRPLAGIVFCVIQLSFFPPVLLPKSHHLRDTHERGCAVQCNAAQDYYECMMCARNVHICLTDAVCFVILVSKQSQPQLATSKQLAPLMNLRLTRSGVLLFHGMRLFIAAMSVDTRLASGRTVVLSQNPMAPFLLTRAEHQMCVVHTCELPAEVTGFTNELLFVGFLVRRL
jgi:hypothetical protein